MSNKLCHGRILENSDSVIGQLGFPLIVTGKPARMLMKLAEEVAATFSQSAMSLVARIQLD